MEKYLIKKSQAVAILIFFVEIIGSFALAQIDASENVLGKIGYVAIIYGVLSTIALYQVKKEWLTYVHSYVDSIPQKLCDTVPYCYLYGREVAVQ